MCDTNDKINKLMNDRQITCNSISYGDIFLVNLDNGNICDKMVLEVRNMRKYSDNLIDRLGGIWWIIGIGVVGLVLGIVVNQYK